MNPAHSMSCDLILKKKVNAWLADKDAEALRCQKLLMEEEEAAQK
ncbi:C2H2 zinc finger protein, partial [Trifolium medium]|nr:C2H2 zinc finger protein [Trifolium medium]